MLSETGLVPKPMAARIARGIRTVIADEAKPGSKRSGDYLVFEALLIEAAGPDASRLHTGRSRQDIGATSSRIAWREAMQALQAAPHLAETRARHNLYGELAQTAAVLGQTGDLLADPKVKRGEPRHAADAISGGRWTMDDGRLFLIRDM